MAEEKSYADSRGGAPFKVKEHADDVALVITYRGLLPDLVRFGDAPADHVKLDIIAFKTLDDLKAGKAEEFTGALIKGVYLTKQFGDVAPGDVIVRRFGQKPAQKPGQQGARCIRAVESEEVWNLAMDYYRNRDKQIQEKLDAIESGSAGKLPWED